MTFLGKLAVLFQAALSLLFLALAVGVYTQRVNWPNTTTETGSKIAGRVELLQEKIKKLAVSRDDADYRYFTNRKEVAAREAERPGRQKWYADAIAGVKTGKSADGSKDMTPPVVIIPGPGANGLFDIAKATDPFKLVAEVGKGEVEAKSLAEYAKEFAEITKNIAAKQEEYLALIAEEKRLTADIVGGTYTIKKDGEEVEVNVPKGLRKLLAEQLDFAARSKDEQEALMPEVANRWAEAQLQLKRKATLEARRAELLGTSAAGR